MTDHSADRAALRDIAETLYAHDHPGWRIPLRESDTEPVYLARAGAVLAVLPDQTDRAAVLNEGAARLDERAAELTQAARKDPLAFVKGTTDARYHSADCWNAAADELRRLAAETQPDDVAAAIASCPSREMHPNPCRCPCYGCKHHCAAHDPDDPRCDMVAEDPFAEVVARCPEHGTRTETYAECRCPTARPDDTTGA